MTTILELYGTLIITFIGFIIPVITILISLFPQGTKSLALKYENERQQSERNIANEMKKREKDKSLDYRGLGIILKSLGKKNSEAKSKLSYLSPGRLMLKTSIPFVISFGILLATFLGFSSPTMYTLLVLSLVFFGVGVFALCKSMVVLFEVGEITSQTKSSHEDKIIELLSSIVEKSGVENLYLKEGDITLKFNDKTLIKNDVYNFSVNTKHQIPFSIVNSATKMAKNIEVGLIFPVDVLIEKKSNMSISTSTTNQIIRFKKEIIQATEDNNQGKLELTFLKAQKFQVQVFIKGENVRVNKFTFNINVVN